MLVNWTSGPAFHRRFRPGQVLYEISKAELAKHLEARAAAHLALGERLDASYHRAVAAGFAWKASHLPRDRETFLLDDDEAEVLELFPRDDYA